MPPSIDEVAGWRGRTATDSNGDKIGKIEDIYLDQDTEQPEWLAVSTGGGLSFIPLAQASATGKDVRVPFDRSQVEGAPRAQADGELSQDEEAQLYRHYGLDYDESRSDSGLPEGGVATGRQSDRTRDTTPEGRRGVVGNDVSGPETDDAMTRSEEELRVGKTQRETGRARLKKYIVTENVSTTVPVEREEVRVEREPITDANIGDATSGGDLTEEEHEVTLHAEEATVDKQVVPKERVRLDKDVVRDERQVSEDVSKEQIEMEGDETSTRGDLTDRDRR